MTVVLFLWVAAAVVLTLIVGPAIRQADEDARQKAIAAARRRHPSGRVPVPDRIPEAWL